MFKKLRPKSRVPTHAPPSPIGLARFGWVGYGAVALVLLLAALFLYQWVKMQTSSNREQFIGMTLEAYSERIGLLTSQHIATLERLAREPVLAKLIAGADPETVNRMEGDLRWLFPQSLRVRLLPAGLATIDNDTSPPLGYACLDLLRQVEAGTTPPPEVHRFGNPEQHLDMVRPVFDSAGRVAGHLMVTFDVAVLERALTQRKLTRGYLELRQGLANGQHIVLGANGAKELKQGEPVRSHNIAGTGWNLAYWSAAPAGGLTGGEQAQFWAVFGVALALVGMVFFVLMRVLGDMLSDDFDTVTRALKEISTGSLRKEYPIKLNLAQRAVNAVMALAPKVVAQRVSATQVAMQPAARSSPAPPPVGSVRPHEVVKEPAPARAASPAGSRPNPEPVPALETETAGETGLERETRPKVEQAPLAFEPAGRQPDPSDDHVDGVYLPTEIFRAYDIRGIVGQTLTAGNVRAIGRALGTEAGEKGQQSVIIGRDGRLSGPELTGALIDGLMHSGRDVIDLGRVPTPLMYFAAHTLDTQTGVILTGSHNPPQYNGLKIVLAGETLHGEGIQALRERLVAGSISDGAGTRSTLDVAPAYINAVVQDVRVVKPLKVVVDCGNGVAGEIVPPLLRELGCEVFELYCKVDGNFPNHHPDPSDPDNLTSLVGLVRKLGAHVGLAFDGDGDRLGVVDSNGEIIWPDRLLMLFARDVLVRNPGAQIIYDVKCTRHIEKIVHQFGGEPLMWKTGHSLIKAKMKETGALLAGEMSGHVFFKERWYGFDDAIYTAARLLEILANEPRASAEVFADLPDSINTPELHVEMAEGTQHTFIERLVSEADFNGARITTIDGLRADFDDGWGLVRASNTTPCLVLRFEADNPKALRRIEEAFRQQMLAIDGSLQLPF